MSRDRVAVLSQLGLAWRVTDHRWARGLQAAADYRRAHGHIAVPGDYVTPDGFPLGTWIRTWRYELNQGALDEEKAAALEALGMQRRSDPRWTRAFQAAAEYHAVHGHVNAPKSTALGAWIGRQRRQYRAGTLAPDRAAALEQLGIVWDPRGLAQAAAPADACRDGREEGTHGGAP